MITLKVSEENDDIIRFRSISYTIKNALSDLNRRRVNPLMLTEI